VPGHRRTPAGITPAAGLRPLRLARRLDRRGSRGAPGGRGGWLGRLGAAGRRRQTTPLRCTADSTPARDGGQLARRQRDPVL